MAWLKIMTPICSESVRGLYMVGTTQPVRRCDTSDFTAGTLDSMALIFADLMSVAELESMLAKSMPSPRVAETAAAG